MKRLSTIAFTIVLLTGSSISQASTLSTSTITLFNAIGNDTDSAWSGYQVCIWANKPITLSDPVVDYPDDWLISVSPTAADGSQWEVDVGGGIPIAVGDDLGFSYQMSFSGGGLQYTERLTPIDAAPIPEPGTLVLVFSGLLGLATLRALRRRRA